MVYRCIRQQHNDNWFFPRSNGLSDHTNLGDVLPNTLEMFCPTLPYIGDVLSDTTLSWRRSAQHCPTLETFCPTLSYLGDVLPNTALPWRRSAQHCPTLKTFCPTLLYLGDVLPNTALPWKHYAQHCPTLETFCPSHWRSALPWRPSSSSKLITSLTHEITHVDEQLKCHEQSATMMLAAN